MARTLDEVAARLEAFDVELPDLEPSEAVEKAASTRTLRVTCLPDGEPEEVSEATLLEHNPDLDTRFLSSGESMVEGGGAAVAYLIEVL